MRSLLSSSKWRANCIRISEAKRLRAPNRRRIEGRILIAAGGIGLSSDCDEEIGSTDGLCFKSKAYQPAGKTVWHKKPTDIGMSMNAQKRSCDRTRSQDCRFGSEQSEMMFGPFPDLAWMLVVGGP